MSCKMILLTFFNFRRLGLSLWFIDINFIVQLHKAVLSPNVCVCDFVPITLSCLGMVMIPAQSCNRVGNVKFGSLEVHRHQEAK